MAPEPRMYGLGSGAIKWKLLKNRFYVFHVQAHVKSNPIQRSCQMMPFNSMITVRLSYLCIIQVSPFMNLIENSIQKIVALCKKYKVNKLFMFGSMLTDRFNDDSDVDCMIDLTLPIMPLRD